MTDARTKRLAEICDHVDRLAALRDLAALGGDHGEVSQLDRSIKRHRREITDMLSTDEIVALTKHELQPEGCMKILREEEKPSAALAKLQNELWHEQTQQALNRLTLFVAEKGHLIQLGPNHGGEVALTEAERRGAIKKFEFKKTASEPQASVADAYQNHVGENK